MLQRLLAVSGRKTAKTNAPVSSIASQANKGVIMKAMNEDLLRILIGVVVLVLVLLAFIIIANRMAVA